MANVGITNEMVERAAKAMERQTTSVYGWSDEQFDIWWNSDPLFVERLKNWGYFQGTGKERVLFLARLVLESAYES